MKISNVTQNYFPVNYDVSNIQNKNKSASIQAASKVSNSTENTNSEPRTVDMRNVSLNEINELIKSGVDGLLDRVPFIAPHVIAQYGSEAAADIKLDFMGQIEAALEFKKKHWRRNCRLRKSFTKH